MISESVRFFWAIAHWILTTFIFYAVTRTECSTWSRRSTRSGRLTWSWRLTWSGRLTWSRRLTWSGRRFPSYIYSYVTYMREVKSYMSTSKERIIYIFGIKQQHNKTELENVTHMISSVSLYKVQRFIL